MKTVLYFIMQCIWGFPQTFLGLILFLTNIRKEHFLFHGAVVSEWKYRSSVSFGLFVFISKDFFKKDISEVHSGEINNQVVASERLLVHEYGHTIQSLVLGPLYLLVIGLPSVLWASLPYYDKKRRKENISYYSFYTEKWADIWGEQSTRREISNEF